MSAQATALVSITASTGLRLPPLIAGAGDRTALRFIEFFTVTIRNKNTRAAFARAAADFLYRISSRQAVGSHGQATSRLYSDAVRLARYRTSDADEPRAFRPGAASFRKQGFNAGAVLRGSNRAAHRHECFNGCGSARPRHHCSDDVYLRPRRCRRCSRRGRLLPAEKTLVAAAAREKRQGQRNALPSQARRSIQCS